MGLNFNAEYSAYYDMLNKGKTYAAEADFAIGQVLKHKQGAKNLLELGSGTGGHAAQWCKLGFSVTGIERSTAMCEQARAKQITGLQIVEADIMDFNLDKSFDAALAMFHVISYLRTNQDVLQSFERVHTHLTPGGIFFFDAWYSPAVLWQKPETRTRNWEDEQTLVTRRATAQVYDQEDVVNVHFEIEVSNKITGWQYQFAENHPMRHFSIPAMALLAKSAGFELLETMELLTGSPPSVNTWNICFILQKV